MKVAFFIGALNRGGTESLILDVCRCYKQTPFDVVCLYRKEGTYSDEYHNTGARLVKISRDRSLLRYMLAIRKFVKNEQIDIIHAQTPSNAILCISALAFLKVKIVTTIHGCFTNNKFKLQLKFILNHCEKVCCVSEYERKLYLELLHMSHCDKLITIYNGINFNKIDVTTSNLNLTTQRGLRLIMVGNFNTVRSQNIIVRSVATLRQRGIENFDFYFIGMRTLGLEHLYDDCVEFCRKAHLTNVHFLGARNDVPSFLKSADGFVYSSVCDTFGIAVVEAMAAGLPVIVNDWAVMKEITKDGQWAMLFKTEDAEDCANKIENLLNHLEERKKQAKVIAQEVREEYSIEKHIKRLSEIYQTI